MTEQRTAQSTAPGAAYRGRAGQTRNESVQVWMPSGQFRTLHVYVSVDASADPALAKAAREGVLHTVTDDVELAVPFVYHDPELPLFVLVIPEPLRHQALKLRAEWLARIAEDTAAYVPDYVAGCECVVGADGLRARIASGTPVSSGWEGGQDEALRVREQELSRWEAELEARERDLEQQQQQADVAVGRRPRRRSSALVVDDDELEEVTDDLEPSYSEPPDQVAGYPAATRPARDSATEVDDDELVDETHPTLPPALPFARLTAPEASYDDEDVPLPPEDFAGDYDQAMCAVYREDRVWLYTRGLPPRTEGGELELLVQVDPEASPAVVLLTLVRTTRNGSSRVMRFPIRYLEPEGEALLSKLAERFVAELVYVGETSLLSYEATLAAPREGNVRAVLEHLEAQGDVEAAAYLEAERACLANPPPWRDPTHPFETWDEDQQVRSATEAAVELDELSSWLTPAQQKRLTLLLSVPAKRVQEHTARAIRDALGFGLELSAPLVEHALARGIVEDEAALLQERIAGLLRTSRADDGGGMDKSVLATLWVGALEEAARRGLSLDEQTVQVAERFVGEKTRNHLRALKASAGDELAEELAAVEQPTPDVDAALRLAAIGGLGELRALCEASARMEPEAAARVYVALARRGPGARDALVAELDRPRGPRAQLAAALVLSVQRAPEAIEALVRAARDGDEPAWRGVAFALGHYGGGSLRAISRAVREAEVPDDRAVHVYAHLCLHGARSAVARQARGHDTEQAATAKRAIELASQLKSQPAYAQGLEGSEALTVFSKRFHELWHQAQG